MAEENSQSEASQRTSWWSVSTAAALMAAIWILLVGGVHRDEMIVGVFSVIGSTVMLRLIAGVRQQRWQFTVHALATGWRLPGYAAQDLFVVAHALLRTLLFRAQPDSAYCVCGFKTSKHGAHDAARRVLVTTYTSATPNMIVIGVDYAQSRILFHQLVPAEVNEMMRDLGALA